ncbi:DUF1648 domain-containing protein [Streptomyces caniscabiei]|uniref:DUF1648 domain-containing protein n=1 Tax=Streptomyces caniscabiei TaxID=2746961 RepID=UPI0029B24C4B|nr:DUF1648 domain-containing protein [Streptomyces caniscabiei]MDX2599692.1 DUF1648 domain-containing protein [Streptomyces caniscabiei]MDX2735013.1 DUF1648 domain-containing protein [Streptomyces caniscabiei]MDX2784306.1 DUF1648 domain-containing protein [Streptomyces caniscabiei]
MTAIRRCALTAAPFVIASATYVGVFLANRDRLPERIATHFSGDGGADGFMSRTAALWFGGGLLVGLGVLFTVLTLVSKEGPGARLTAAVGAGTAVTLGYPLVVTVLVNTDIQDPAEVQLPLWHVAVLLLAGVATGALAWWLMSTGPRPAPAPPAPSLPLAEGEAAAWSRTMTSRALLFPAGAVALGGLFALLFVPWPTGMLPLVLGLTCLAFASVRVTVDRRGLTVASTVLPRPRLALPLGRIVSASSIQVNAMGDFGGWGYRIRPNRRGVVLRSGEALSVRTAGGREYVVTVNDSTTAAALLNGLVNRHAQERD